MFLSSIKSFLLFAVASLNLHSAAVANECEDQYNVLVSTDVCAPIEGSDQCPASCQESLDTLNTACSVNGATIGDEPYDASAKLAQALMSTDEPCNSTVANELLARLDDTCQDWGTIYRWTPLLFCNDDTVCSQFCKGVQDGFYRYCAVDDEVKVVGMTNGEKFSTLAPVSEVIMDARHFLGSACKEYAEGKKLKESITGVL